LPAFGEEQVANALCAITICRALGVEVEMSSLESFSSEAMAQRGERKRIGGIDVIIDCYNANPSSMRAGLKTFAALAPKSPSARKLAVIGDMLELGEIESKEHIALGQYLADTLSDTGAIDVIITVGERARMTADALRGSDCVKESGQSPLIIHSVSDAQEAGELLAEIAAKDDIVYLKASRGVALERVLPFLKARGQA
jgi:UDP-N-acetylmuramoyl-tripeptide--D-alanyl-D-alanine ligase